MKHWLTYQAELIKSLISMHRDVIEEARANVYRMLGRLDPHLTYHNLKHTQDVVTQSRRIALEEGIKNSRELLLLEVAALYHDTGFLQTYTGHEEVSCRIFLEDVQRYPFTEEEQQMVLGLIQATKIPQTPRSRLERIICDADLDYLGRDDFFKIGDTLRQEFLHFHIVANNKEWEALQLKFLMNHHYFTEASRMRREPAKQVHVQNLLQAEGT